MDIRVLLEMRPVRYFTFRQIQLTNISYTIFSAEEGDIIFDVYIEEYNGDPHHDGLLQDLTVMGTSSVEVDGITRRIIDVGGGRWIEGIGNTKGLFLETFENISGYSLSLECMNLNDTILYSSHDVVNIPGNCTLDLSTSEQDAINFNLYPNPVKNVLTCDFSSQLNIESVSISNLSGTVIQLPVQIENSRAQMDFSTLPNGIYIISFHTQNNAFHERIIKN